MLLFQDFNLCDYGTWEAPLGLQPEHPSPEPGQSWDSEKQQGRSRHEGAVRGRELLHPRGQQVSHYDAEGEGRRATRSGLGATDTCTLFPKTLL